MTDVTWLQTTQSTSGGAVTAVLANCSENYVDTSRPQFWEPDLPFFGQACHADPARWLALLLIKSGDGDTHPGPTITRKQAWIFDICHTQIHCRKLISIRCNRIEHLVHRRCAGIRLAQYTDIWNRHLHKESRLSTHTDTTPPNPLRPYPSPTTPRPTPPIPPQPIGYKEDLTDRPRAAT